MAEKKIEVRRMGTIERGRLYNRLVDGYAVFVDGVERQPWLTRREAKREAKRLREES